MERKDEKDEEMNIKGKHVDEFSQGKIFSYVREEMEQKDEKDEEMKNIKGKQVDEFSQGKLQVIPYSRSNLAAKCQKFTCGHDRISELPDSVLLKILGYLTVEMSVQSSILSKRWRHLWRGMSIVRFDDTMFKTIEKFWNFVDIFLLRRDKNVALTTFALHLSKCSMFGWNHRLCMWMFHAISMNLKVLELKINNEDDDNVPYWPNSILICDSLESLTLITRGFSLHLKPTDQMGLGKLKILHLENFKLEGQLVEKLISKSPFLKDLYLQYCDFAEELKISSETLRTLTTVGWHVDSKVDISTPNLLYLCFTEHHVKVASLQNLFSLMSASISDDRHYTGACGHWKVVRGLYNVKSLDLLGSWCKCTMENFHHLPMFGNLKNLKLGGWCKNEDVRSLIYFLRCSPNLEVLRLEHIEEFTQNTSINAAKVIRNLRNLSFECPHLMTVEIRLPHEENKLVCALVNHLRVNLKASARITVISSIAQRPHFSSSFS